MCIKKNQNAQMYYQAKVTISSTLELLLKFTVFWFFCLVAQPEQTYSHVCLYCNTEG